MTRLRVTEAPDGGDVVMLVSTHDTGMVSVYVPDGMKWVTPATAERMAVALTSAARATGGQR
jgi:hypothetical protein